MARCGATFDEDRVPPWIRGDFRGVWEGIPTHPGAARLRWRDFQAGLSGRQNWDTVL